MTTAITEAATLRQMGGNTEGGRMTQIIADSYRCQVREAVLKARGTVCAPVPISRKEVPLESTALEGRVAACYRQQLTVQAILNRDAQPLRGVRESLRIAQLQQRIADETERFQEYIGPRVPVVCPPMPTEITNAHLPKPSTRCDTLNLLATGSPPNNLPRGQA